MHSAGVHPVQLVVATILFIFNVGTLVYINKFKARNCKNDSAVSSAKSWKWSWELKRVVYVSYMAVALIVGCILDRDFDTTEQFMPVRTYLISIPLSLLDYYFSDVTHIPVFRAILGTSLWCSTVIARAYVVEWTMGYNLTVIVTDMSWKTIGRELIRIAIAVPCVGILSDIFFSPIHRLMHRSSLYPQQHQVHHEYKSKLTSMVIYHGAILDDLLMGFTISFLGGLFYHFFAYLLGMDHQCFSNVTNQLLHYSTIFIHAHDVRCAFLLFPFLPNSVNVASYHRVHHLLPGHNFGLTMPSDIVWDWILGQDTIIDLDEAMKRLGDRNWDFYADAKMK